ncbi:MAG TPA: cytochrome c peroxidase [Symbiobacteriaceae bacterium]|jgi:cytochrome c peroxidase
MKLTHASRRFLALTATAAALTMLLSACNNSEPFLGEGAAKLGPLPPVSNPADNPMTPDKVDLGKMLFFDGRLSGDTSTPCAACHIPDKGWGDGNALSRGYPGTKHWRNSQTVLNSAYYTKLFWAGEVTSLEKQADSAATGNLAGNLDPQLAEERLRQIPEYVQRWQKVFGTAPTWDTALKAIAAFERTIVSTNVPFDKYVQGDKNAISSTAKEGLALFAGKANCIQCHSGALFTNQSFAAIGVPRNKEFDTDVQRQIALRFQFYSRGVPEAEYRKADDDLGLYYFTKRDQDKYKFRVPSLRDLTYTGPYMHNGVFTTLDQVVDFYNKGGGDVPNKDPRLKPLNLSSSEQKALVAFLLSLSGDPVKVDAPKLPEYAPGIPQAPVK